MLGAPWASSHHAEAILAVMWWGEGLRENIRRSVVWRFGAASLGPGSPSARPPRRARAVLLETGRSVLAGQWLWKRCYARAPCPECKPLCWVGCVYVCWDPLHPAPRVGRRAGPTAASMGAGTGPSISLCRLPLAS